MYQIAGLKCGGQGLNLTCANRVIITDLWWNMAAEQQAFSRVYRNHQKKETYLFRIMADKSIDQRIKYIQEKKLEEIKNIFGDHKHRSKKLKAEEVLTLFGAQSMDGCLDKASLNSDKSDEDVDSTEEGSDSDDDGDDELGRDDVSVSEEDED